MLQCSPCVRGVAAHPNLQQRHYILSRWLHSPGADSLAPLINLALRRNDALAVFNHAVSLQRYSLLTAHRQLQELPSICTQAVTLHCR